MIIYIQQIWSQIYFELRNTYQSENNFGSNIRNFNELIVLSLNIQSLLYLTFSLRFRETSKKGGIAIYCKKDLNPKLIPGLDRQNTFTFESIAIDNFKTSKF